MNSTPPDAGLSHFRSAAATITLFTISLYCSNWTPGASSFRIGIFRWKSLEFKESICYFMYYSLTLKKFYWPCEDLLIKLNYLIYENSKQTQCSSFTKREIGAWRSFAGGTAMCFYQLLLPLFLLCLHPPFWVLVHSTRLFANAWLLAVTLLPWWFQCCWGDC